LDLAGVDEEGDDDRIVAVVSDLLFGPVFFLPAFGD
jgi:hypothetical protein